MAVEYKLESVEKLSQEYNCQNDIISIHRWEQLIATSINYSTHYYRQSKTMIFGLKLVLYSFCLFHNNQVSKCKLIRLLRLNYERCLEPSNNTLCL